MEGPHALRTVERCERMRPRKSFSSWILGKPVVGERGHGYLLFVAE
jgi:hypothetical protein